MIEDVICCQAHHKMIRSGAHYILSHALHRGWAHDEIQSATDAHYRDTISLPLTSLYYNYVHRTLIITWHEIKK